MPPKATNLKRKSPFESQKEFANGLKIVLTKVLTDYCIPEKTEECRQYLSSAFSQVPNFSNINFIEQQEAELNAAQQSKKEENKERELETVKKYMYDNLKTCQFIDYGSSSLDESFDVPLPEALDKVQEYRSRIAQKKVEILYYHVLVGGFIKRVKTMCDGTTSDFLKILIERDCSLSSSMAYFYIQLYELASKFHRFQFCAISLHCIRKHWKCVNTILKNDQLFWNSLP